MCHQKEKAQSLISLSSGERQFNQFMGAYDVEFLERLDEEYGGFSDPGFEWS